MIDDLTAWQTFDREYPAPTFFARPAFARAVSHAFPHLEPVPLASRQNGRSYFIPALRTRSRVAPRTVEAFPFGAYSCVIDEGGAIAASDTASAVLRDVASRHGALSFVAWPLGDQPDVARYESTTHETAVIDCSGGLEQALSGMRGVTRRMVGQAQRRGVTCVQHACDDAGLSMYYAMLEEASLGWGRERPSLSRGLLDAVAHYGGDDVELWFAMLEGEAIAGGFILFGAQELFFWSAAMRRDFSRFRPSNALNARLIERACERGVRWYNLGASEGLSGVERFKSDLGATAVPYVRISAKKPSYRAYTALRNVVKVRHAS